MKRTSVVLAGLLISACQGTDGTSMNDLTGIWLANCVSHLSTIQPARLEYRYRAPGVCGSREKLVWAYAQIYSDGTIHAGEGRDRIDYESKIVPHADGGFTLDELPKNLNLGDHKIVGKVRIRSVGDELIVSASFTDGAIQTLVDMSLFRSRAE